MMMKGPRYVVALPAPVGENDRLPFQLTRQYSQKTTKTLGKTRFVAV